VDIIPALLVLYIIRKAPPSTRSSLIARTRNTSGTGSTLIQPYGGHATPTGIAPLPSGFGHKEISGGSGSAPSTPRGSAAAPEPVMSNSRFAEVDPLYISFRFYSVGTPPRSDRGGDLIYAAAGHDARTADLRALGDAYHDDEDAALLSATDGGASDRPAIRAAPLDQVVTRPPDGQPPSFIL